MELLEDCQPTAELVDYLEEVWQVPAINWVPTSGSKYDNNNNNRKDHDHVHAGKVWNWMALGRSGRVLVAWRDCLFAVIISFYIPFW